MLVRLIPQRKPEPRLIGHAVRPNLVVVKHLSGQHAGGPGGCPGSDINQLSIAASLEEAYAGGRSFMW